MPRGPCRVVFPLSPPHSERDAQRSHALLEMAEVVSRSQEPAEALLESEQLLSAYFSASKVGLCILDADLRYLAINKTLAEMNGIPAEAHLGKSVREMLGDFAELIEPQVKRVLADPAAHPGPRNQLPSFPPDPNPATGLSITFPSRMRPARSRKSV